MVDKLGWDHRYRPLAFGEIIEAGDECRRDDGTWVTGICVGELAPDPAYTSHRVYRRLKATPANGEQVEPGKLKTAYLALLTISQEDDGPLGRYAAKIARAVEPDAAPTEDARSRVKVLEKALGNLLRYIGHDGKRVYSTDLVVVKAILALGNKETYRHG